MFDLQAVYIRDFIRLSDVEAVEMLRIRNRETAHITGVQLNGYAVKFLVAQNGDLLVSMPDNVPGLEGTQTLYAEQILSSDTQGPSLPVSILRTLDDRTNTTELVPRSDLLLDQRVLRVTGQPDRDGRTGYGSNFNKALSVLVNGISVGFAVQNENTLYCTLPEKTSAVETIEVVASTQKVTGTSFFTYQLGEQAQLLSGTDKMVSQFIKLLLTSQGSDTFSPDVGGDFQKWAGQTTDANPSSQVARAIVAVRLVASKMLVGQIKANLPADETLADVEVTSYRTSAQDPSVVELGLRLSTLSGKIAAIGMLVGDVSQAAQSK